MNPREFKKLVKERQRHTHETLLVKGEEYSRDGDRLHNFKSTAAMNDETPAQSLWGMYSKHIISVRDMVKDTALGIYPTKAQIDEKIGDSINYNHLLEGLFIEGLDEQQELNRSLNENT